MELETEDGHLPYHTEVRWSGQGKVLQRRFMRRFVCSWTGKGKTQPSSENEGFWVKWLSVWHDESSECNELAAAESGSCHLWCVQYCEGILNQTDSVGGTDAARKLELFPSCKTMKEKLSTSVSQNAQFVDKISMLAADLRRRFAESEAPKSGFKLLSTPLLLTWKVHHQTFKWSWLTSNAMMHWGPNMLRWVLRWVLRWCCGVAPYLLHTMLQLRIQATQTLSMFGSKYQLCEQLFSLTKLKKASNRCRLAAEHIHSILRISSALSLAPNIDERVSSASVSNKWTPSVQWHIESFYSVQV